MPDPDPDPDPDQDPDPDPDQDPDPDRSHLARSFFPQFHLTRSTLRGPISQ